MDSSRNTSARMVAVMVLVAAVLVAAGGYGYFRWVRIPATVHEFGRDYHRGGTSETLSDIRSASTGTPVIVNGSHVVSGGPIGHVVPTVIYVRRHERYVPYALEGGP